MHAALDPSTPQPPVELHSTHRTAARRTSLRRIPRPPSSPVRRRNRRGFYRERERAIERESNGFWGNEIIGKRTGG
ncbi:hypothetical protein SDJN03_15615, partial [Cucurbita argyrosperma subsp. sororia]